MPVLVADIGNSEIDFGVFDGRSVRCHFSRGTRPAETSDEIVVFLEQMLRRHRLPLRRFTGAAIGSVVPGMTECVRRALRELLPGEPLVIGPETGCPIRIAVASRQELGADRLADAVAAQSRYGGPVIVVDCGSATTLNVVNRGGAFVGGAILPGVMMMLRSLSSQTARLPDLAPERPVRFIGKGSAEAMQAGVVHGVVGALTHLIAGMTAELDDPLPRGRGRPRPKPRIVATGGLAGFLAPSCPWIDAVEPHLTLEGIGILQRHNV